MSVTVIENNLAKLELGRLRNKNTSIAGFRMAAHNISSIILQHALASCNVKTVEVSTPLTVCESVELNSNIVFIPILRAGLVMLSSAINMVTDAKVGYLGLQRNEKTAMPEFYYSKLPDLSNADVFILDPMLATGGSIAYTIEFLSKYNLQSITIASIISAREGIEYIQKKFPDVKIFTAAVDPMLDENKFIVPGLGDFGDRYHGTV